MVYTKGLENEVLMIFLTLQGTLCPKSTFI